MAQPAGWPPMRGAHTTREDGTGGTAWYSTREYCNYRDDVVTMPSKDLLWCNAAETAALEGGFLFAHHGRSLLSALCGTQGHDNEDIEGQRD